MDSHLAVPPFTSRPWPLTLALETLTDQETTVCAPSDVERTIVPGSACTRLTQDILRTHLLDTATLWAWGGGKAGDAGRDPSFLPRLVEQVMNRVGPRIMAWISASALAMALTFHSVSSFSLLSSRVLTAPKSLRCATGAVRTQKSGWVMQGPSDREKFKLRQGRGGGGGMERLAKKDVIKGVALAASAVCASVSANPPTFQTETLPSVLPTWNKLLLLLTCVTHSIVKLPPSASASHAGLWSGNMRAMRLLTAKETGCFKNFFWQALLFMSPLEISAGPPRAQRPAP